MAAARTQAVVMAVEDIHWADPSTLDLLRGMAERGALAPLFVVITARPEFRPPWGTRSHHSTITLSPLDRHQVHQMVAELSARHALPKDVIDGVTERTGGVPLFVEEVTRLLLERGEYGGVQAIPPTLQQSLMARLDRLGSAREIAQIGAVIGRDFPYALLRDVAGTEDQLYRRVSIGWLTRTSCLCKACRRIRFIGSSTLSSRTQPTRICSKAAAKLCTAVSPSFCATTLLVALHAEPEMLAHHFTQAGMTEASVEWWDKAGQRSLERSALVEAIAQFTRALDLIASFARYSRAASRPDQAASRPHNPAHAYQRIQRPGNQGGCGAGTFADRTG